jgi:hypothetical protein
LGKEILRNYIFHKETRILLNNVLNAIKTLNGTKTMFVGLVDLLIDEKQIDKKELNI